MPNRCLFATANSIAAMTSLVLPAPFLSRTLSDRSLTPGAIPAYGPFDDAPPEPMRPATCVPWPYRRRALPCAVPPRAEVVLPTSWPVKSPPVATPESMTATVMLDPVNQSCRPSACFGAPTVL